MSDLQSATSAPPTIRKLPNPLAAAIATMLAAILLALSSSLAFAEPIDPSTAPAYLGLKSHEVAEGETLLGLAERYGITPQTILWANELENGELLRIGQTLVILPVSGVLHKVSEGESINSIAQLYGVEAEDIVDANGISDAELIRIGDYVLVPGGAKNAAPAQAPAPVAAITYTVKSGDSLNSIAAAFGIRLSSLLAANGVVDPDYLRIGQQLTIPGGQQPAAAPPPPAPQQQAAPAPAPQAPQQSRPDTSTRGEPGSSHSFVATVTTYCLSGRTASGTPVRWGVVAVDPRVIPLGSRIQIDGFDDVFVAEDTGGGVKGNWVDIWYPNCPEARAFGTQARRITVLD